MCEHEWEYWNLIGTSKCKKCGKSKREIEGDKKEQWSKNYYEDKQYMKKDNEWKDAIRHRKSTGGGVGYFNSKGERIG